jgi:LmbE family N-acetylglucosaminyl deacetylase
MSGAEMPVDANARRVLVVTAHPDDVDFGAAGTIARFRSEGTNVTYCVCTDGDAGGYDEAVPREHIADIRRAEQRAAAAAVGVREVTFLGYRDGRLTVTYELRRDISRVIRRVRPHRMLVPSPERNWARVAASHPDHLATGEAAVCAVYPDARNPFAHPELLHEEGLAAWTVPEVWLMGHPEPDHYVDVTDTVDAKLAALRAHASQTSHRDDLEEFVRGFLALNARRGGLPEGRLAEAFKVVSTP